MVSMKYTWQPHCLFFKWNIINNTYVLVRSYCECLSLCHWYDLKSKRFLLSNLGYNKPPFVSQTRCLIFYQNGWVMVICEPYKRLFEVFPTLQQDLCKHCYELESMAWLSLVKLTHKKKKKMSMVKCQCWQMLHRFLAHNDFSPPPSCPPCFPVLFPLTPCPTNTVNSMTIRNEF